MLAMVNGGADLRTTSEQENSFPPKSIPVPVLVAHEKYNTLQDQHDPRRHDAAGGDSSFLRPARGPLASATNTIGNLSSSSSRHHVIADAHISGGTESDSSAKAAGAVAARSKEKRSTKSKCPPGLRSGKWTPEEEAFTNMIIHYFKRGLLHIEDGTSLRWYLAKRLNCEAMRVTKKLKGNSSIGKQIFRALESSDANDLAIKHAAEDLAIVENLFLDSLAVTAAAPQPSDHLVASYLPRVKKSPPPRNGVLLKHQPSLEAAKHAASRQHADDFPRAASEDAKLLLHFFEGVHETTAEEELHDNSDDDAMAATPGIEKKRLFSELESSQSSASSSRSDARTPDFGNDDEDDDDDMRSVAPPASKRQVVKIENLMG